MENHSLTRTADDAGQFSLSGAQPKTAFLHDPDKNRWGIPSGATPTTHVLKPALGHFNGHAENEHFCLTLATEIGLKTATSDVITLGEIPVIVLKRYDRKRTDLGISRIHQEDFCQATRCYPGSKYPSDGGPSVALIAKILSRFSSAGSEDTRRFADALIFNWLIKGTDAHAKNYSILISGQGQIRLAPLYDIASALPYPKEINPHKARLAMKIGSEELVTMIKANSQECLGR